MKFCDDFTYTMIRNVYKKMQKIVINKDTLKKDNKETLKASNVQKYDVTVKKFCRRLLKILAVYCV